MIVVIIFIESLPVDGFVMIYYISFWIYLWVNAAKLVILSLNLFLIIGLFHCQIIIRRVVVIAIIRVNSLLPFPTLIIDLLGCINTKFFAQIYLHVLRSWNLKFLTLQIDGGIHVDLDTLILPSGPPLVAHLLGFRLLFRAGFPHLGILVGGGEVRQEARQIGLGRKGAHQLLEAQAISVLAVQKLPHGNKFINI